MTKVKEDRRVIGTALVGVICLALLVASTGMADAKEEVVWGFNEQVSPFWDRGKATIALNTDKKYVSEGVGSLRISLFGIDGTWGWIQPVNITVHEVENLADSLSKYQQEMLFDVYVPRELDLQGIRIRYWPLNKNNADWIDLSEWVELKPGWNKNIHIKFKVNWSEVQVFAFDIKGGKNLNSDFYLDNVRFIK